MRIELTNGKKYRLSWRHIDASQTSLLDRLDPIIAKDQYDRILGMENMFQEKLKKTKETDADFSHAYERLHGVTECFLVELKEGVPETRDADPTGEAWCSVKDKFDKEKGRKMSLARSLDRIGLADRNLREQVWDQYFGRNW